ncbi:MAG: bifunctional folylpolyglutamate synthase/dihydrofolate synthase [Nitrospirota bacterium]
MSYRSSVRYLYGLRKYGTKFGLDNIVRLAAMLGNPHESFLAVHVAGTNGKGSTSAILTALLQAAGFRTGLFTSPHLVSFTERIRVDGQEIEEDEVIGLTGTIRDRIAQHSDFSPTFFEVVTAISFLFFKKKRVEIAVFETGMGGRLDATNIVQPLVTVITRVSCDHREFLGATLEAIAREKAGIIKPGVPVVSSRQKPDATKVLEEKARKEKAAISFYGRDFSSLLKHEEMNGVWFDYREGDGTLMDNLFVPLAGEHQMENASLAIKAFSLGIEQISSRNTAAPVNSPVGSGMNQQTVREGLQTVRWPGRLQLIAGTPAVLLDGAHNPEAASVLAISLKNIFLKKYQNIILVLGIMDDKDIPGIMEPLLPIAARVILTAPAYDRAAKPDKLFHVAQALGYSDIIRVPTVHQAIDVARKLALSRGEDSLIVITGSFYTIGEASEILGKKGVLADLRE